MKRIAWCITGGALFLNEVIRYLASARKRQDIDVYISKAGIEVVKFFNLSLPFPFIVEKTASGLEAMRVLNGKYDLIVIAPCSANTVAKLRHGIADSLCTIIAAQGQKLKIPVYILPTDIGDQVEFFTKSGKRVILNIRQIDKENLNALQSMELFQVFEDFESLKKEIEK